MACKYYHKYTQQSKKMVVVSTSILLVYLLNRNQKNLSCKFEIIKEKMNLFNITLNYLPFENWKIIESHRVQDNPISKPV